jgi:uncharacterized membrane protein YoaK (UPF0700 family)
MADTQATGHVAVSASPKAWVAVLLACVAGCVDVLAFGTLHDGFVSHLSGDTAHAAIALAQAKWSSAAYMLLPLPGFVFGAASGRAIADAARERRLKYRLTRVLLVECALLLSADVSEGQHVVYLAIILVSMAMGLQNAALRHVAGHRLRTTFVTGMLVAVADASVAVWLQGQREQLPFLFLHAGVWAAFGTGAVLGTLAWESGAPPLAYLSVIAAIAGLIMWDLIAPIEPA